MPNADAVVATPMRAIKPFNVYMATGERYSWRIDYRDGSTLSQYRPDGTENKVDFSRPAERLYWVATDPCLRTVYYDVPELAKPVLFFRRYAKLTGEYKFTCYCIGVETKEEIDGQERTRKRILYMAPAFEVKLHKVLVSQRPNPKRTGRLLAQKTFTLRYPGSQEVSEAAYFEPILSRWVDEVESRVQREWGALKEQARQRERDEMKAEKEAEEAAKKEAELKATKEAAERAAESPGGTDPAD